MIAKPVPDRIIQAPVLDPTIIPGSQIQCLTLASLMQAFLHNIFKFLYFLLTRNAKQTLKNVRSSLVATVCFVFEEHSE